MGGHLPTSSGLIGGVPGLTCNGKKKDWWGPQSPQTEDTSTVIAPPPPPPAWTCQAGRATSARTAASNVVATEVGQVRTTLSRSHMATPGKV